MAATPAEALEQLRALARTGELAEFCRRWDVELLVAFGSVIQPSRAARAEDLDLAVLFDPGGDGDLVDLANALTDLTHCDRIDLLDLARAGPVAQEQALVGTLALHEETPATLAAIRDRAIVRRMDTEWLRRIDLDLMASS
jgi:predicted nucleotidyltransferase